MNFPNLSHEELDGFADNVIAFREYLKKTAPERFKDATDPLLSSLEAFIDEVCEELDVRERQEEEELEAEEAAEREQAELNYEFKEAYGAWSGTAMTAALREGANPHCISEIKECYFDYTLFMLDDGDGELDAVGVYYGEDYDEVFPFFEAGKNEKPEAMNVGKTPVYKVRGVLSLALRLSYQADKVYFTLDEFETQLPYPDEED